MLDHIDDEIKKIFFEVFPGLSESDFDWGKKQNDYNDWDSFSQLSLITMVESKFSISITDDESVTIRSAEDMQKIVNRHKRKSDS